MNATAYIVAQTRQNISFLQSTSQISLEDAQLILSKLPSERHELPRVATPSLGMNIPPLNTVEQLKNPALLSRPPPPIPSTVFFWAQAHWNYNDDGRELNDLKFASGDTIEVIDSADADWWRGRLNGREGLFPSSYVKRLPGSGYYPEKVSMPPMFPSGPAYNAPQYPYHQQKLYQPQNSYHGPPHGRPPMDTPYPPDNTVSQLPPQQTIPVGQDPDKKKHGLFSGKIGNSLAHSSVGGVGFGAGSAVGGGIVNAIF